MHTLWKIWPHDKQFISDSGSNFVRHTQQHSCWGCLLPHMLPNLSVGVLLLNSSMKPSEGLRLNSNGSGGFREMSGEGDNDETRIPTICRIVLTMPLNLDIDKAVFTRSTHNTPSDGAGRLDRPILIPNCVGCKWMMIFSLWIWNQQNEQIAMSTSSMETLIYLQKHQRVLLPKLKQDKGIDCTNRVGFNPD